MTHPHTPAPGPSQPTSSAAPGAPEPTPAEPGPGEPEPTTPTTTGPSGEPDVGGPATEPVPAVPRSAATGFIPDVDPFTETDLFPALDAEQPARTHVHGTGGFAGLSRPSLGPPTMPVFPSPPPAGAGHGPELPMSPVRGADRPPVVGPPVEPAWASAPPAAPPPSDAGGWPPMPGNVEPPPGTIRRRGPVLALAALAGILLLVCGVLVGLLWAGSDDTSEAELAGSTATTTAAERPVTPSTRERSTSSAPTTSAPATTTSVAPTTTATSAPAPSVDPAVTSTSADPNALVADFSWTPDPATPGQAITVVDRSSGAPTRWIWTWNSNVVSSNKNKGFTTSLRVDTPVTLTVCRGEGTCATVTKVVKVS